MKKKLLILLCLGLVIPILSACGPKQRNRGASSSPSPTPDPTPTVIIFSTPAPDPTPSPTPTETPKPTSTPKPSAKPSPKASPSSTPTPEPTEEPQPPVVTKNPTGEVVPVGGSCTFIAKYENAVWAVWHFVSPDGSRDLAYNDIQNIYTDLKIINGYASTMSLENIPAQLNGWKVYCHFSNDAGSTDTAMAQITVQQN
ncbi:MAG: hypothetical protein J5949_09515 [Oscillospiraceae bacterium]|nr:hypothetical protein [Oscillospiraceae bacterium]